jgi:signal transduction histidine kinase
LLRFDQSQRGLVEALEGLCRDMERTTGVRAECSVEGMPFAVSEAVQALVFRVAREALRNVDRHARATRATVHLSYSDATLAVSVRDDGVGLLSPDVFERRGHLGLRTIRQRIADQGGKFFVEQATPHGVVVEAVIPARGRNAYAARTRGSGR